MLRRDLLVAMAATLAGCVGPRARHRRRRRRRVRRRIRRRIRRRVAWRVVAGRRVVVAPVAVAVGWELVVDAEIVVVREVRGEILVVADPRGRTREIAILREDDDVNRHDERGSELPAGDASPFRESEEEVDEEYDE